MSSLETLIENRVKPNAKVLLVHPAFKYVGTDCFPLGLGYISAYMKQFTNDITVFDEHEYQLGKNHLEKMKPDIVGISSTSPAFYRVKKLLQSIRRMPETIRPLVIMGGTHASFCPEDVLSYGVDIAFMGEADLSLPFFMKKEFNDLSEVPGIAFESDELPNYTPKPTMIPPEEMDNIPFPAREFFHPDFYPVMSITTSRGCPYDCNYCSATRYWDRRVRFHSVDYVERELLQVASLGYKYICFEDATFSVNIKRAIQICERLIDNSQLQHLTWSCETRPDRIREDMLQSFEASRCILINLGVESASEPVLKAVNRTVPLDKLYSGIQMIQETNIPLQMLMVFGLPGENEQSVRETIKFLEQTSPDRIVLSLATAYPGTDLYTTDKRAEMPLEWVRRFQGHGEFSPLYLADDLTPETYKTLAEQMLEVVNRINKQNQARLREKHKLMINKASTAFC
ncbi:MAG: B12-binding domain-containing radical SAM protein [Candidatus Thorarchaeota archaeon]